MSEKKYYLSVGVFKFDHFTAGFPQLNEIAQKWAEEDEHFKSLVIRGVSETNYGIDFIYYRVFENDDFEDVMKQKKEELKKQFGDGFYAWDYHKSSSSDLSQIKPMLIKQESLELE